MNRIVRTFTPALLLALVTACGAAAAQPPADGPATAPAAGTRHAPADVAFMQHMVAHHAQAVEMAALVDGRTRHPQLHLLAERITVAQEDEMDRMRRWLAARGEAVPGPHAHHGALGGMPGMASPDEMARLAASRGAEFDRLFLELMIRHHEGALTMVRELFASETGGQESEMYHFASEVESDQAMEIERMRRMQEHTPTPERDRG